MKLIIVAAVAENLVIGKGGRLPWHVSDDLKRFKELTTGYTILMGRKTFDSLGRLLPDRRHVVLSSKPIEGVETFKTIEDALAACRNDKKVFVIGGGQIYRQLLDKADALYLTLIDEEIDGDTLFPPYKDLLKSSFKEVKRERREGFQFVDYERVS